MTAGVRPLLWWAPWQLEALRGLGHEAWSLWAHDWLGVLETSVTCAAADGTQGACEAWFKLGTSGQAQAWIDMDAHASEKISTALFGADMSPAAGTVASALVRNASDALRTRLAASLGLEADAPGSPAEAVSLQPWGGDVIVSLSSPGMSLRVLLNGVCAGGLLAGDKVAGAAAGELPLLQDALSPVRTRASIELTPLEMSVGSLLEIRLGDVLRLEQSLDEPLHVKIGDQRVCSGHLGRSGIFKAVELAAHEHQG